MAQKTDVIFKRLQNLKKIQYDLARKIDRAQIQNDVTEQLVLENRYKQLALRIEELNNYFFNLEHNPLSRAAGRGRMHSAR